MIATVTSKGQITLPASVRKALKIKTGDKLDFEVTEDGEIRAKPISNNLASLANVLPKPKRRLTQAQMEAAIRKGVSKSL
ncbi:MAG: AbrB/MazE/SpoVT family DNA-binding domain-containing protein [Verrucomicrobia bacterium]|nr:AbrB/MazE/SpoVT family DNA-binding domain-containing protein [Verrucomicrobiota bacterium]